MKFVGKTTRKTWYLPNRVLSKVQAQIYSKAKHLAAIMRTFSVVLFSNTRQDQPTIY